MAFVHREWAARNQQYAEVLQDSLKELNPDTCEIRTLPAGEATKSYEHLQQLHSWMLSSHIHRDSVVFAVGGGVIGDLAGFAASTVITGSKWAAEALSASISRAIL